MYLDLCKGRLFKEPNYHIFDSCLPRWQALRRGSARSEPAHRADSHFLEVGMSVVSINSGTHAMSQ